VHGFGRLRLRALVQKLLDPPGEARSDLAILVDLADRLGHGPLITARTPEAVWNEWRTLSATTKYDFAGITYDRLRRLPGLQWPCPTEDHPGTVRRYCTGDPFVPAGKTIYFYGKADGRSVVYARPYVPTPEQATVERPFLLTTGRVLEQWHTGTMTERIPELAQAAGPARFEVNADDAFQLGIATGDLVEVEGSHGSVRGTAVVSSRPRLGVLFAAFYDVRLLVNDAVTDAVDPVSKQPEYKVTAVSLRRMEAQA
jgi:nitrate reductase (cytochrome)